MILMIYRVTVAPGRQDDYLLEFCRICNEVRRQQGCIEYEIYLDSSDPRFDNARRGDLAVIVEKWDSIEDLQAHGRSEVMQGFKERVKDLRLSSEYELLTPHQAAIP